MSVPAGLPSTPSATGPARSRTRQATLCLAALACVAFGLGVRTFGDGAWTGPVGDALYAVLIYVLVAFLVPRKPQVLVAGVALTACVLIELLQLTGLPARLGETWPPLRLVLGTTFGMADVLAYAVGCTVACAVDRAICAVGRSRWSRRHTRRGPADTGSYGSSVMSAQDR